jgi:hypothetical protein
MKNFQVPRQESKKACRQQLIEKFFPVYLDEGFDAVLIFFGNMNITKVQMLI